MSSKRVVWDCLKLQNKFYNLENLLQRTLPCRLIPNRRKDLFIRLIINNSASSIEIHVFGTDIQRPIFGVDFPAYVKCKGNDGGEVVAKEGIGVWF